MIVDEQSVARNLFDLVPPTLFQPLAAPSRRLYAGALARLYDLAQGLAFVEEEAAVEAALSVIAAADQEEQAQLAQEMEAELAGEQEPEADLQETYPESIRSEQGLATLRILAPKATISQDRHYRQQRVQARAVLRRLENTGWLKREKQRDLTYQYTLAEYAFPLLESFRQITEQRAPEFDGLIYGTYLLLNRHDEQMSGYALLQQAQEQTRRVAAGLKQLQHNIGAHIERLVEDLDVREVLQNFITYRAQVSPSYHRLKTSDHLSRYRLDIQQAVGRRIRDAEWVAQAVQEACRRQPGLSPARAEDEIHRQLAYIQEQFEQMDELMARIDDRHSRYAEAAVTQVRYRVGGGPDQLAQLIELAHRLGQLPGRRAGAPPPPPVIDLFRLFELNLLTQQSLYTPRQAQVASRPEPLQHIEIDSAWLDRLLAETEHEIESAITPEKVRAFIAPYLDTQPVIASADLPLNTVQDWLYLIGLNLYADLEDSPYQRVGPPPAQPWLQRGGFRCPNLRFARPDAELED